MRKSECVCRVIGGSDGVTDISRVFPAAVSDINNRNGAVIERGKLFGHTGGHHDKICRKRSGFRPGEMQVTEMEPSWMASSLV